MFHGNSITRPIFISLPTTIISPFIATFFGIKQLIPLLKFLMEVLDNLHHDGREAQRNFKRNPKDKKIRA
jgi:hypothetical protein